MKSNRRRRKEIGIGGDGYVTASGQSVTKWLKPSKGVAHEERLSRFVNEITALKEAKKAGIKNIVEIYSTNIASPKPYYTMRRYTGTIDELLSITRVSPRLVATLLLPIVESLDSLANLPRPIFHRDLKPSNLLFHGAKASYIFGAYHLGRINNNKYLVLLV